MAFSGEMHNHVRLEVLNDFAKAGCIGNVGPNEAVAGVLCDRHKRLEIARIGELVDNEHIMRRFFDDMAYNRRADETSSAGDEEPLALLIVRHRFSRDVQRGYGRATGQDRPGSRRRRYRTTNLA